jgi:hypothetical protein
MNQRIRELAEQAHCYACEYARRPDYSPHNPYNESMYKRRYNSKFAELIVKECEKAIRTEIAVTDISGEVEKAWEMGMECGVYTIKKHFGVEE